MVFILTTYIICSSLLFAIGSYHAMPTSFPLTQFEAVISNSRRTKLMTPEEIRFLILQARDAWVREDVTAFATLFSTGGEFIVPGNRWVGKVEIEKAAAIFFADRSDVKITIRRIIIERNQAVVEWHWEDREKVTGRHSQADDAIVIDFQDGKIIRWREYIDTSIINRK
jgi:uncharacterized protein (TIGR02246 family)